MADQQDAAARKAPARRKVNLALQGGGAHGAYTWGVLDRLLEEPGLEIEGITGTSAGAMNAAVLAHGIAENGAEGGREALRAFWHAVGSFTGTSSWLIPFWERLGGSWNLDRSPVHQFMDVVSRILSPYQTNPFNYHPLREIVDRQVNYERLRQGCPVKLFVCATNVRTGRVKVFENEDMSGEVLLASACLPFVFQAVEIDGEAYWDGGYMGNPSLFPLYPATKTNDIILVPINPLVRDEIPKRAQDIANRVSEISFNSSLLLEMRSIEFVQRLLEDNKLDPKRYKRILFHSIDAEDELRKLGAASKMNTDWAFLEYLRDVGRRTADDWLAQNLHDVGKRSTINIAKRFLNL